MLLMSFPEIKDIGETDPDSNFRAPATCIKTQTRTILALGSCAPKIYLKPNTYSCLPSVLCSLQEIL
jgi:hypothetical protein